MPVVNHLLNYAEVELNGLLAALLQLLHFPGRLLFYVTLIFKLLIKLM
jgi:hypothetical protein